MRSIALLGPLLHLAVAAQTPISDARQLPPGTTVTVRGIITNGSELGGIRYVQDATAGIALFPGTGSQGGFAPLPGADVTATGVIKLFNGLLELDPITSYTIHSNNNVLPAAQLIAPPQIGANNESELVRVNGCLFADAGTPFPVGTTSFFSNGEQGVVYLRNGHPLVGTTIPAGLVDLIAIVSRFTFSDPPVGGYQLLARTAADLIPATGIHIISGPQQHDIVPTGFALQWTTNISGVSQVAYGATPALGQYTPPAIATTTHDVAIDGLAPATFHYARAFSVAGGDTAWSTLGLYATASQAPGLVRAYFNRPVNNEVAIASDAVQLFNAFDDTIRAHIDEAVHTLDYAVYNTSFTGIANALNAAFDRGVVVRVIAEGGTGNSALNVLDAGIPVLYRTDGGGSGMHNKFLVIDAEDPLRARVLTGSTNMTAQSFFNDANNLVIVQDQALARCYRTEFEEMWGGDAPLPDPVNSRFGPNKADNTPHLFNVGGTLVQCWFSPSDGTTARITEALGTADHSVAFALFSFTHYGLADALITARNDQNATVRGLIEGDDMQMDLFNYVQNGGVLVSPDLMPEYLHHKYAIVDHAHPGSDPLVITGSHNWSYNAENHNDENTLIIHSATIADHFHQEWHARGGGSLGIDAHTAASTSLHAWPNPTTDVLHLRADGLGSTPAEMRVHDAMGRQVLLQTVSGPGPWRIHTGNWAAGVYVVSIQQAAEVARMLFVRE